MATATTVPDDFGAGGKGLVPGTTSPTLVEILQDHEQQINAGITADLSDANPQAIGTADEGVSADASRADHVHAHGNQLGGTLHADAIAGAPGTAGFMSGVDKLTLDTAAAQLINLPTQVQAGVATLVAGKTAAIAANVSAGTRIIVTVKTPNTPNNTVNYAALASDRVNGTPGSFIITALLAAGTINIADVSTVDWVAVAM